MGPALHSARSERRYKKRVSQMSLLLTPLSLFINILAQTTFIIEKLVVFVIVATAMEMGFQVAIFNLSFNNDIDNIILRSIFIARFK